MNPTNDHDYAGVLELLRDYYEGLWRCDVELLARVFRPDALYATPTADGTLRLDMQEYLPRVAKRTPPAERGVPYDYTVESVEFAGPDTAMARLRCSLFDHDYTDFLSLVRVAGRWSVQAKVFHGVPHAPAASS